VHHSALSALLTAVFFALIACERTAEVKKPRIYQRSGLQFRYPGNWKVTQDSETEGVRDVLVETPGAALATIEIHSKDNALALGEFARAYSTEVRSTAPHLNMGESVFGEPETSNGYRTLHEQFPLKFLGEEISHRRVYWQKQLGDKIIYIICQATDEDIDLVDAGFEEIVSSLQYDSH